MNGSLLFIIYGTSIKKKYCLPILKSLPKQSSVITKQRVQICSKYGN